MLSPRLGCIVRSCELRLAQLVASDAANFHVRSHVAEVRGWGDDLVPCRGVVRNGWAKPRIAGRVESRLVKESRVSGDLPTTRQPQTMNGEIMPEAQTNAMRFTSMMLGW